MLPVEGGSARRQQSDVDGGAIDAEHAVVRRRDDRADGQTVDAVDEVRRQLQVVQHVLRHLVDQLITDLLDLVLREVGALVDAGDVERDRHRGLLEEALVQTHRTCDEKHDDRAGHQDEERSGNGDLGHGALGRRRDHFWVPS